MQELGCDIARNLIVKKHDLLAEVERLKKELENLKNSTLGDRNFVGSNDDEMVLLKLRDYSTEILARVRVDSEGFKTYYVMQGSGKCTPYGDFGVEWIKKLKT